MAITYKHLTLDHMDALMVAGRSFHSESAYHNTPLNEAKMRHVADALMRSPDCFSYGAMDGEIIAGFILGEVTTDLWTDALLASEHAFYVLPEHRSSGIGSVLLAKFLHWAAGKKAGVRILVSGGVDDHLGAQMMENFGLKHRGYLLGKEFS